MGLRAILRLPQRTCAREHLWGTRLVMEATDGMIEWG